MERSKQRGKQTGGHEQHARQKPRESQPLEEQKKAAKKQKARGEK